MVVNAQAEGKDTRAFARKKPKTAAGLGQPSVMGAAGSAAVAAGPGKIQTRMDDETLLAAVHGDRRGLVAQQSGHAQGMAGQGHDDVGLRGRIRGKVEPGAGGIHKGQKDAELRSGRAWKKPIQGLAGGVGQTDGGSGGRLHTRDLRFAGTPVNQPRSLKKKGRLKPACKHGFFREKRDDQEQEPPPQPPEPPPQPPEPQEPPPSCRLDFTLNP